MPFKPPPWVPELQIDPPDTISIADFMLDEKYGRRAFTESRAPFICGISGKAPSAFAVKEQVELLARGLAKELGWQPNEGKEFDKVAGIFSLNTIDYLPLTWAVHRLGGIVTPANAQYSSSDLAHQLKDSGSRCLFTCWPLLQTAIKAAKDAGIARNRIYLLELPDAPPIGAQNLEFGSVTELRMLGKQEPSIDALRWTKGEGKRRAAFICYSSGTSGLPKGVIISHHNVITNTMQVCTFENPSRQRSSERLAQKPYMENVLGLLPLSHIYGLVMIAHCSVWRGDGVVILPKFEFKECLQAIQDHAINTLFLVPPIVILMTKRQDLLRQYDLSSVQTIFTGAAPLGQETAEKLWKVFPKWLIRQAYGLTETCVVVSSSADFDIWLGSSGSLITGVEGRLVTLENKEITEHDQKGELWVKSPSLVLGYLGNDAADKETFVTDGNGDRWLRTGDEAMIKKAPSGHDHLFIVDRIKELIKVKGFQVAPAELEAHLLLNPHVTDCAVIPVPDDGAGEVPKAYVVKSHALGLHKSNAAIKEEIIKHVQQHKSRYKWLEGGVEFVEAIPKTSSGKVLRRLLRDKEKQERMKKGARL
ncbi:phenylacetyl-CoA ligase-like protein [Dactylonectria estremocensis]|uniref:Phenylacetyl-CoA ligase-like protein n=1 Tax=Dactylonectria estremocensis TaxID=1079267 RepID=A0A9P9DG00_9HYPO|nr:phenylacetyl-CoA ligase-like protein [Dactylonectria estremocensis]